MLSVLITTPLPTPYQVELFDALAASGAVDLTVLYSLRTHTSRSWRLPEIAHEYCFLDELSPAAARKLVHSRDLVVFSGYHPHKLRLLIAHREECGKPWAFWGEKRGVVLPEWLGRYYRAAVFPQLRSERVLIWAIGSWAVDGYRREFGGDRTILNVPYFSGLNRFLSIDRSSVGTPARRFLFSGSLIKRKGVDLLMRAFVGLAHDVPDLELHLVGDGPLREHLRRMSAPVAERVHFHGFRQWEELPTYYANADVLCAPSRYDGWGLVIPEGLAAGLLVVSTDQTGAALDLIDCNSGWVVRAGALEPLTHALRSVASIPNEERVVRIERGRSTASRQNMESGVDRVLSAFDESLAHWNTVTNAGVHHGQRVIQSR